MSLSLELLLFTALSISIFCLIFFFFRTFTLLKKKKIWAICRNSSYLFLTFFVATSLSLLAMNILTYHRLTHETPIAAMHVERLDKQFYRLKFIRLNMDDKKPCYSSYDLQGDEWQVDARIIKWHGWANIIGFDAAFQFDRISGRYQNIELQRTRLPSVFSLEPKEAYDLWDLKNKYRWLPGLDAKYGQSVFLAMKDKQFYQLYMTQSGLITRETKQNLKDISAFLFHQACQ